MLKKSRSMSAAGCSFFGCFRLLAIAGAGLIFYFRDRFLHHFVEGASGIGLLGYGAEEPPAAFAALAELLGRWPNEDLNPAGLGENGKLHVGCQGVGEVV